MAFEPFSAAGFITVETITRYTFDNRNNRATMVVTGHENHTTTYTYDLNNRLLSKTVTEQGEAPRTTTFTYDRNGNQLTQVTGGVQQTHTFDAFNRLVSVTRPAAAGSAAINATYTYRTGALRHSKAVNGVITTHVWDRGNIVLERNATGAVINRFHRGRGHLISSYHHGFYVFNVRGDVVQRTNASGNVIHSYRFDAFGNQLSQDSINTNPFRFSGEYYDWETGFIYLRARYLNTMTGRFISADPFWGIHNMQGSPAARMQSGNLFAFVMNNPVMWADPTGLFSTSTVRDGRYWVSTSTDRYGRTSTSFTSLDGVWAGSYDTGGWSATPSGVGVSSISHITHLINNSRYVSGNGLQPLNYAAWAAGVRVTHIGLLPFFDVTTPVNAAIASSASTARGLPGKGSWGDSIGHHQHRVDWLMGQFFGGGPMDMSAGNAWERITGLTFDEIRGYVAFRGNQMMPTAIRNFGFGYVGREAGLTLGTLDMSSSCAIGRIDHGLWYLNFPLFAGQVNPSYLMPSFSVKVKIIRGVEWGPSAPMSGASNCPITWHPEWEQVWQTYNQIKAGFNAR